MTGVTNALNVVADGLRLDGIRTPLVATVDPIKAGPTLKVLLDEIKGFYQTEEIPPAFLGLAADEGYLKEFWQAWKRAFEDNQLPRRFKTMLAFAVSLTSRSDFGTAFHLNEARRLGVSEAGIREVLGVTQMFSSYTKIADVLQLEPDMGSMAAPDLTPAPGGKSKNQG